MSSSFLRQSQSSPGFIHTRLNAANTEPGQRYVSPSRTDDEGAESDASHPLYSSTLTDDDDAESDVSRPTLRRLTSETERQLAEHAESSRSGASQSEGASNRGSLDLLRMSPVQENAEVEVLVHHVKPTESLAGIALLYGIDLAILRKVNKLWSNDSIHSRTRLYIPIEACKWNKASETFIRGPGPGQITLVSKTSVDRKGKAPQPSRSRDVPISASAEAGPSRRPSETPSSSSNGDWIDGLDDSEEWDSVRAAQQFLESTNMVYDRASTDSIRPTQLELSDAEPERRIVDVVRIPNSQLRFFPRPQKPPDTSRRSLEQDMRRVSLERGARRSASLKLNGPKISNDLSTLPTPYRPAQPKEQVNGSRTVRIRPGSTGTTTGNTLLKASTSAGSIAENIASRFSSFFDIPPPPDQNGPFSGMPPRGPNAAGAKRTFSTGRTGMVPLATGSGRTSRQHSEASSPIHPDVSLEMRPTAGVRKANLNGKSNKKLD